MWTALRVLIRGGSAQSSPISGSQPEIRRGRSIRQRPSYSEGREFAVEEALIDKAGGSGFRVALASLAELVSRSEEGAVREQTYQDGGYGDAAQEHVHDYYLQPDGF